MVEEITQAQQSFLRSIEDDYDKPGTVRILRIGGGGLTALVARANTQGGSVNTGPINFTVTFSRPVVGFTNADVNFAGSTVGGTPVAAVTGGPSVYNVAVTGMTGNGLVAISIPAGAANDAVTGAPSLPSFAAQVMFDTTPPAVTINQATGQVDPAGIGPILFDVVFNKRVMGFIASDVVISGTAGGTLVAAVSGSGANYSVAVSGMTTLGTVVASIPAGGAFDAAGNFNAASTSTDNSVFFNPAMGSTGDGTADFSAATASGLTILLGNLG